MRLKCCTYLRPPDCKTQLMLWLVRRRCRQMDVIAHPRMGMNRQNALIGGAHHRITKALKVRVARGNRLPVVATLNDVLWLSRQDISGYTRHLLRSLDCYATTNASLFIVSDPHVTRIRKKRQ